MARDAARAFQSDLEAGKVAPLPPAAAVPAPAENAIDAQSSDEQRRSFVSKKDARGRWPVPAVAWAPERLRRDLRVLTTLVAALDAEKGVDGSSREPRESAAEPPESALDDGGERKTADDVFGDAASVAKALEVRDTEAPRGLEDVEHETENSALIDALAHAVDRRVYYLWLVHGVDYYAGAELLGERVRGSPALVSRGRGRGASRAASGPARRRWRRRRRRTRRRRRLRSRIWASARSGSEPKPRPKTRPRRRGTARRRRRPRSRSGAPSPPPPISGRRAWTGVGARGWSRATRRRRARDATSSSASWRRGSRAAWCDTRRTGSGARCRPRCSSRRSSC